MIYIYELRDQKTNELRCVFEARSFDEACRTYRQLDPDFRLKLTGGGTR
jgi:hypothetical protein